MQPSARSDGPMIRLPSETGKHGGAVMNSRKLSPFDTLLALVVAILLFVPATYRVIRQQVPAPFSLPIPVGHALRQHGLPNPLPPHIDGVHDAALMAQEAALDPGDYHAQVAAALVSSPSPLEVGAALEKLTVRFPNEPSLYAHLMAAEWRGSHLFRNVEPGARAGQEAPLIPGDAEAVERFERYARSGERLDPDNAFFTFLRAAPLYALLRDSEARACILQTRTQGRYDDCQMEGVRDVVRLKDSVFGWRSQMDRYARSMAPDHRLWELTDNVAKLVVAQAGSLEASGRQAEGCDLRLALAHFGGLMRVGGTSMTTSLVGCSCVSLAFYTGKPVPGVRPQTESPHERTERLVRQADTVLVRDGRPDMRAAVDAELNARDGVVACSDAFPRDPWLVDNTIWVIGLWIVGAILVFRFLLEALIVLGVAPDARREPSVFELTARVVACGLLVACQTTFWNADLGMLGSRTSPYLDPGKTVAWGLCGATLTIVFIVAIARRAARASARQPGARRREEGGRRVMAVIHRIEVVAWIGIVIATAVMEARFTRVMDLRMQSEGRYLSTIAHVEWPGPVSWSEPAG